MNIDCRRIDISSVEPRYCTSIGMNLKNDSRARQNLVNSCIASF